jgi:hypothetical protein
VEDERECGVDPPAVGEAPMLTRRRWRCGGRRGGGVGARVAVELIVARVRV